MKLVIAKSALDDLQDIKLYYQEQGVPNVGQKMVTSIFDKIQTLTEHPDSGRKVPEFDQENIREIIHPPFRIVYLRNTVRISLVRVWRSERLLLLPEE
ncbi:type II toxin-antitoxin system RelE/ParE family toxin [Marinomonas transparens]|uniref:Type II toxin-antitoxin system RelE/ParE family toxin n=1 Tax=Marinomonas transparens TaxID=2795388 RepID=A0A934JT08_9GAMM|nr:type II toxin-antitoxin system RelE/ParE family toxin [Marinomonas transparens]MBJ7537771.1 type II toxin-antitoxin system RelE/ParE family toxin [Marinomonas transparens]